MDVRVFLDFKNLRKEMVLLAEGHIINEIIKIGFDLATQKNMCL